MRADIIFSEKEKPVYDALESFRNAGKYNESPRAKVVKDALIEYLIKKGALE